MSREFENKILEEIAERMGESDKSSRVDQRAQAEFLLRQTKAVQDTAEHNRKYAKYMFWTVVIMAISFILNTYFQYINMRQQKKNIDILQSEIEYTKSQRV